MRLLSVGLRHLVKSIVYYVEGAVMSNDRRVSLYTEKQFLQCRFMLEYRWKMER